MSDDARHNKQTETVVHIDKFGVWTMLPDDDRPELRYVPAEELAAAEARAVTAETALQEIANQQQKTLGWLRSNRVVFDGPLGNDPANWQHVAFSIYTDLCEAASLARAAVPAETDAVRPEVHDPET
jgi:hypothetical protein